ncbi:MAG: LytTR family DNA-binding domain-containing protein [Bacteroidota bacterium]
MIKAIAVDDEPLALKVIEHFSERLDFIKLEKTFTKPLDAIKHLNKFPADLLFLDINMPVLNGIDFYKSLKQNTMVIFTTTSIEHAIEGFNLSAVDYLLKPFTFERFNQAVTKARDFYNYQTNSNKDDSSNYFFVRADYSLIKIVIANILYIEALDDYLKIHIQNEKMVVARMTMKSILEKLPANEFFRIHRSFIVPLSRVKSVRNKMISIEDQHIPLGNTYEADFFKVFRGE